MNRTPICSVSIFEGNAVERPSEDGPMAVVLQFVSVLCHDGRELVHYQEFDRRNDAVKLAQRVIEAGTIDDRFWIEPPAPLSFEESMAIEAAAERWEIEHGIY